MSIGLRIKQIRNSVNNSKKGKTGYTQTEFANELNMTRSFISQVEIDACAISDRTIKDICRTFNVNEEWLRTGSGEMFNELSRKGEIAYYMGKFFKGDPNDAFKLKMIEILAELPEDEWERIADICVELAEAKKKNTV